MTGYDNRMGVAVPSSLSKCPVIVTTFNVVSLGKFSEVNDGVVDACLRIICHYGDGDGIYPFRILTPGFIRRRY